MCNRSGSPTFGASYTECAACAPSRRCSRPEVFRAVLFEDRANYLCDDCGRPGAESWKARLFASRMRSPASLKASASMLGAMMRESWHSPELARSSETLLSLTNCGSTRTTAHDALYPDLRAHFEELIAWLPDTPG